MIQRFFARGLSITMQWVDDSIAEEELHSFLRKRLHELRKWVHTGNIEPDDQALRRIIDAIERLRALGMAGLPNFDQSSIPHASHIEESPAVIEEGCPPAVHLGCINVGAADNLLAGISRDEPMSVWQMEQLEALLHHIEVRRQTGLRFQPSLSGSERWKEIQKLSSLFTRYARHQQDYRFLNTALKLNDWSYKHYRKSHLTPGLLGYLQAVLEAEALLLEMTT